MRAALWLIFALAVLASVYFGYAALYWAGMTATPVAPAWVDRAQRNVWISLALTGFSFAGAVMALVFAVRSSRRENRAGAVLWLVFIFDVVATVCFGYAALYWGWVTATPATAAGLARARRNFSVCAALTVCSSVTAMAALVFAVRSVRSKDKRGFELLP